MQHSICEWNTLLLICPILGKPILEKQPYWWGVIIALPHGFFPQTTVYASWHWIKLWRSVMWCMLMVNVNFWPICRTYSLSVFISWCSYYHYLSLHHNSFWVPVEPHCAKYYRNTSLAFLVWLHSSRSAIFMYLLPCYSNFFPFNKWDI